MEGLLKYQSFVIESLEQENHKFQEESSFDFESLLKDGRKYHEKVLLLKKDVTLIQDKSQRLKERALKLKDRKMKEALDMEFKRDHIQEQEKKLQPLTPSPKTSSWRHALVRHHSQSFIQFGCFQTFIDSHLMRGSCRLQNLPVVMKQENIISTTWCRCCKRNSTSLWCWWQLWWLALRVLHWKRLIILKECLERVKIK